MESLKRELHDTRQQVLFENIQKSRDALTDMFEALLEFSRIETGALAPLVDHFELRPRSPIWWTSSPAMPSARD